MFSLFLFYYIPVNLTEQHSPQLSSIKKMNIYNMIYRKKLKIKTFFKFYNLKIYLI